MSVDAELAKPGVLELIGRAGVQKRPQSHQEGYYFQVSDTGAWTLLKSNSKGNRTVLSYGQGAPLGIASWHRLGLTFHNDQIAASVDGNRVTALTDSSYGAGQIGIGLIGYDTDQFDNLSITPSPDTEIGQQP